MEQSELDKLAHSGAELPELSYPDTLYFLMMRSLYDFASRTNMEPIQGKREKEKIIKAVNKYRDDEKLVIHCANVRNSVGASLSRLRTARTNEEKIRVAEEIMNVLDGFYRP